MNDLNTILRINNRRDKDTVRAETERTRHCSHVEQRDGACVLHSARQRSTKFVTGRSAKQFRAAAVLARGSADAQAYNRLVESYFV